MPDAARLGLLAGEVLKAVKKASGLRRDVATSAVLSPTAGLADGVAEVLRQALEVLETLEPCNVELAEIVGSLEDAIRVVKEVSALGKKTVDELSAVLQAEAAGILDELIAELGNGDCSRVSTARVSLGQIAGGFGDTSLADRARGLCSTMGNWEVALHSHRDPERRAALVSECQRVRDHLVQKVELTPGAAE